MDTSVFIVLLVLWLVLAAFRRTRPLSLLVVIGWLLYLGFRNLFVYEDMVLAIGSFIVALSLVVVIYARRNKFTAELKGR